MLNTTGSNFQEMSRNRNLKDYYLLENKTIDSKIKLNKQSVSPELETDTVDIVSIEEKKRRNINKKGLSIAGATVATAATILFLLKGGPKGLRKGVDKLRLKYSNFKLKETVSNMGENISSSVDGIKYRGGIWKKIDNFLSSLPKRFDAINNFVSFKDIVFKKMMYNSFGITKIFPNFNVGKKMHDSATLWFANIGRKSVHNQYNKSLRYKNKISNLTPEIENISKKIYEGLDTRLNKIESCANVVYTKFNHLRQTFLNRASLNGFIAETEINDLLKNSIKNKEIDSVINLRKQLSYTRENRIQDMNEIILNIVKDTNDTKILKSLHNIKTSIRDFDINAAFENNIKELLSKTKDKDLKKALNSLLEIKKAPKGEIDKLLQNNKFSETQKEEIKDWLNSLDKAIKTETRDYVDKCRDLALGSSPTDLLTVLGSVFVLGYELTKSKSKQERESIALKYGIPTLGGIAVMMYGSAKMFSGSKSLLLGLGSTWLLNQCGAFLNDSLLIKNQIKENEEILA